MSISDSDSNPRDARGQSEGSRKNRFSPENQPTRRRQRKQRGDLASGLLFALRQVVPVTIGGIRKKIELHEAFTRSLANDLLKASFADKLKALPLLHKLGLGELMAAQAKVDAERAEFEAERREFERRRRDLKVYYDGIERTLQDYRHERNWAGALLGDLARACSCGACTEEMQVNIAELQRRIETDKFGELLDPELLEELRRDATESPDDDFDDDDDQDDVDQRTGRQGRSRRPDDDPDDDFYTGMLGNT